MIYLASPYSHESAAVRHERYLAALAYTVMATREGEAIFSPIVHSHLIAVELGSFTDFEAWEEMDLKILTVCSELRVICIDGWEQSHGVRMELQHALKLKIPVRYIYL